MWRRSPEPFVTTLRNWLDDHSGIAFSYRHQRPCAHAMTNLQRKQHFLWPLSDKFCMFCFWDSQSVNFPLAVWKRSCCGFEGLHTLFLKFNPPVLACVGEPSVKVSVFWTWMRFRETWVHIFAADVQTDWCRPTSYAYTTSISLKLKLLTLNNPVFCVPTLLEIKPPLPERAVTSIPLF